MKPEKLALEERAAYKQGLHVLIATKRVDRDIIPQVLACMESLDRAGTSFLPQYSKADVDIFGFLQTKEPAL